MAFYHPCLSFWLHTGSSHVMCHFFLSNICFPLKEFWKKSSVIKLSNCRQNPHALFPYCFIFHDLFGKRRTLWLILHHLQASSIALVSVSFTIWAVFQWKLHSWLETTVLVVGKEERRNHSTKSAYCGCTGSTHLLWILLVTWLSVKPNFSASRPSTDWCTLVSI